MTGRALKKASLLLHKSSVVYPRDAVLWPYAGVSVRHNQLVTHSDWTAPRRMDPRGPTALKLMDPGVQRL